MKTIVIAEMEKVTRSLLTYLLTWKLDNYIVGSQVRGCFRALFEQNTAK